jgi:hypothetical protein
MYETTFANPLQSMRLFGGSYLNFNFGVFNETSTFFKSFKLITEFSNFLFLQEYLEKFFVSFKDGTPTFWIIIEPFDFENREKILDFELELSNKYPEKKFSVEILQKTTNSEECIPNNALPIQR